MEKELAEKANKILDMVISGVDKGVEQVPGLTEEYLTYFLIGEISDLLFTLIILFPVVIGFTTAYLMKKDNDNEWVFAFGFGIVSICFFGIMFTVQSFDIVKLKMAPKAYLIEKVRK